MKHFPSKLFICLICILSSANTMTMSNNSLDNFMVDLRALSGNTDDASNDKLIELWESNYINADIFSYDLLLDNKNSLEQMSEVFQKLIVPSDANRTLRARHRQEIKDFCIGLLQKKYTVQEIYSITNIPSNTLLDWQKKEKTKDRSRPNKSSM